MNLFVQVQTGTPAGKQKSLQKKYLAPNAHKWILLLISGLLYACQSNAQGTWSTLAHTAPHANEGVMLVLPDGTIMCRTSSGGTYGTVWDKLTPDAHGSYQTGTWTSLTAMHNDRLYFSSQVLPNGNVYVAGGEYGPGGNNCEIYNPLTNTWTTPLAIPLEQIRDANSTILANGDVLQAVVVDTVGSTEYLSLKTYLYNPATATYAAGPNTTGTDNESAWVKLPDGSILYVNRLSTNSERYIPASNTWIADGTVPIDLYDPYGDEAGAGFLLPNGKAFFIGSSPTTALYTPSGTTSPGTWVTGPNFPGAPQGAPDAPAAMMVNGNILIVVSPTPTSGDHFPDSSVYFEYNYTTNSFTIVSTPFGGTLVSGLPTYIQNMVCLPNGTILYSYQGSSQYYIYTPGSGPLAAGQPTVTSILPQGSGCDTFTAVGTLFNGIGEGAAYGDDWQMSSNYPLVRLTSGTNVYYARTYNWNHIGAVMTGAALDTVHFILPATLPTGTYTMQVVANGNASAGTTFNTCGVSCSVLPVSGSFSLCAGTTAGLSDATTGGTWASGNASIATVNASSGMVTGVAAGTAAVTYTAGACTAIQVITVNPAPGTITGNLGMCSGTTTALADATSGGSWNSGTTGVAAVSSSGVVSGSVAGTSVISYTTAAGCTAAVIVTINASPALITGSSPFCAGSILSLGETVSGGVWTSGSASVATVDNNGNVTGAGPGTSAITYALGTCTTSTVVSVNASPSGILGAAQVCTGATIALSDVTSGGAWSSGTTGIAAVSSSGVVSGSAAGTSVISYTTAAGCATAVIVTINASPALITGSSPFCAGSILSLGETVSDGVWTSGTASVATVDNNGNVTGAGPGTSAITYALGTCTTSTVVSVNASPSGILGAAQVCTGATIALSDVTTGGAWSSGTTGIAAVSSSGVVSGSAAGTSVISYTTAAGCATAVIVTINASPALITGSSPFCAGSILSLGETVSGGVWTSGTASVATVDNNGNVTGVSPGMSAITYALGTCTTTTVVSVNALPPGISGASSVCAGATIALSDAMAGGVWSSDNAGSASVSATGVVTGGTPGIADISYTVTNGCGTNSVTLTVSVNTAPPAELTTGTTTVCVGASTALPDAASGGVWSSGSNSIATVDGFGNVTGVSTGTAAISYTVASSCGSAVTISVVTVNTVPSAGTITGTATLCTTATAAFSDAASGGVWNSSSTGVATVTTAGVVTGVTSGTSAISYTVTNGCGYATTTNTVTVNAPPTAGTVTGTATICPGATVALSDATASAGGAWSSGGTGIASVTAAGVVTGVSGGSANISYTVTGTCGTAIAVGIITVNTAPTAGTITGTATVCISATTALSNTVAGGVWTSSSATIASVGTTGTVTGVAAGTASISYTVTNTCGSAITSQIVTVNAPPATAGAITGTATVCTTATVALADATAGGAWSSSSSTIASVSTTGVVKGVATGDATISYTVTNTCGSAVTTEIVTVNAAPTTAGTISGTATVCVSATTALSDGTAGGAWSSSTTIASVSTTGVITGLASGTATIAYTITNSCGSAITTEIVTVNAAPTTAGTISGTATVCVSATTALTDATTGGVWSSSNTAKASVSTAGALRGVASGTATISYTVTNTCGSAAAAKVVTINTTPTVATISGSTSVAVGSTIALTDATTGGVWSSSSTAKASVTSAGVVRGVATGSATISYTVTNSCGTARATKAITVSPAAKKAGRETAPGSGEDDIPVSSLQIYPNPTSGTFTVAAPGAGVLHLISIDGKEVGRFEVQDATSSFRIPDGLASGVYIYQFADNNGTATSGRLVYKPQ